MLCHRDTTHLAQASTLSPGTGERSGREGMERLTHSAVRPAADGLLSYGYVPPSLQRLHGEARERRTGKVLRLTLVALAMVSLALSAYRETQLALAGPALSAPSGRPAPALVLPSAAVANAAVARRATAQNVIEPAPTPIASVYRPLPLPGRATAALPTALSSDTIPSAARRALSIAQSRVPVPTATPIVPLDTAGLDHALQQLLAGAPGTYGIKVIDLTSNQEVDINATRPMNAASVNKLEILAALYHERAAGRLQLDQTMTTSTSNIQDYGTGVIRYQPPGTRYTLGQLAQVLIEQSDNTASYLLAQAIGLSTIDALVASWGLDSTVVGQGVSSPSDAARFMRLLYQGKLADAAATGQMLGYLSHTAFNDRIPAGVPPDVAVAHKIGTEVNVENDVAIVELTGRPYILSVFAGDVTEARAVPVEQAISRTVYQFEARAKGGS
jgi:beta-lactamase class A